MSKKKVDEVLPAFFRSQGDITTTDYIENNIFSVPCGNLASNAGKFNDNISTFVS